MYDDNNSKENFLKIAELIKINFTDEEIDLEMPKMRGIFEWLDNIHNIKIPEEFFDEEVQFIDAKQGCMREDVVVDGGITEEILSNTKMSEYSYFKVRKIIEKD